jgi:alpha-beta hydrolase superfamily lysophospholipase
MLLTITLAAASLSPPIGPTPTPAPAPLVRPSGDKKKADDIGETVRMVTRDKVTLSGSYFAPRTRGAAKVPGVLLVHDAGSDRSTVLDMAVYLQRKGFGVLAVDLRGHGDSKSTDLNWAEMDKGARGSTWAFASRDLEAAASYLLNRSEIHAANLSLVGVGAGGALVLRHAVEEDAARAVVLMGPSLEVMGFDMTEAVSDLEGLPCLIVAPKEGREEAEEMRSTCHAANDGYEYVTVQVMKTAADELLNDKRLNSSFAKWLSDEVMDRDK